MFSILKRGIKKVQKFGEKVELPIGLKFRPAEKKVKQELAAGVEQKIDEDIDKLSKKVNRKTIFYVVWSIAGMLLLWIDFPVLLFYFIAFFMTAFALYFLFDFFKLLNKTYLFINDFDKNIETLIETKLKSIKKDSIKKQAFLSLSGQNKEDIENFCIAHFVRGLARRLKSKKSYLFIRIGAYTVAVLLFKEVLFKLWTY